MKNKLMKHIINEILFFAGVVLVLLLSPLIPFILAYYLIKEL